MLKLLGTRPLTISELADESGLKSTTVRYYLQNVLDDYITQNFGDIKVEKGKKTLYPHEILERLRFIKKVKEELESSSGSRITPSIEELKNWTLRISDDQVRVVLSGKEDLEFGISKVEGGKRIIETIKGESLSVDTDKYGEQISADRRADRATEHLDRVCDDPGTYSLTPDPSDSWQTISLGRDLEIRHKMDLTNSQKKQLKLTGDLLRLMLSQEKQVTLEEVLDEARRNNRVCPKPRRWNELYKMLPDKSRNGGGYEPSAPLILAAWSVASDSLKIDRLREHIEWASSHGCLEEVQKFLLELSETEWHHLSD